MGEWSIFQNNTFVYKNVTVYNEFIFVVLSTDISVNSTLNGESAGQFIYDQDMQRVPKTITQTTSSQLQTQTIAQSASTQGPALNDLTLLAIESVGGTISIIAAAIILDKWRKKRRESRKTIRS
jgi:hypothetical protein